MKYLKLYTLLQLCKKEWGGFLTILSSMYGDNKVWLILDTNKIFLQVWSFTVDSF